MLLKQVSRKALEKAGRKLGIFIDGVFCFETEDESSVLVDFCIHEHRDLGKNVVGRFLLRRDLRWGRCAPRAGWERIRQPRW